MSGCAHTCEVRKFEDLGTMAFLIVCADVRAYKGFQCGLHMSATHISSNFVAYKNLDVTKGQ